MILKMESSSYGKLQERRMRNFKGRVQELFIKIGGFLSCLVSS